MRKSFGTTLELLQGTGLRRKLSFRLFVQSQPQCEKKQEKEKKEIFLVLQLVMIIPTSLYENERQTQTNKKKKKKRNKKKRKQRKRRKEKEKKIATYCTDVFLCLEIHFDFSFFVRRLLLFIQDVTSRLNRGRRRKKRLELLRLVDIMN